ncbi:histone acetyltransferase GCN5 [Gloeopeniophorella convolvens]|nr:histone acetyltransferase GCN5 [Gloeopeniophorella convolvens]
MFTDSSSPSQKLLSRASSASDEDSQPLAKRPRLSADDDEDEEDQPLAVRMHHSTAIRSDVGAKAQASRRGGKGASMMSTAHTAPVSIPPPTGEVQAEMNGEISSVDGADVAVKMEEQLDEGQLDRLATGVTVDTSMASSSGAHSGLKPEKPSVIELRKGVIQIIPVENDGQPRSHVILTNLKTLFRKQLPVMPREYIARLVFDSNSKCLAICKRGYKVVGGICYRPFPHRGFAEIVFFATASISQEKGYGGLLMDHFKAHIRRTYPDMMHFLTYADNFAVGYFKKQGFSKDITLDRSVWAGYIKDYEGGTIMQCTMLRRVDYTDTREIVAQQREAILTKIRQMSRSHEVYPGLPQFREGAPEGVVVDYRDVPGLRESGWTPDMNGKPVMKNTELSIMNRLLSEMQNHAASWPFREPVKLSDAADYYDVIEQPMDLRTMGEKLEASKYANLDEFADDAQLIFDNCRFYNVEESVWCKQANRLEKAFKESLARLRDL